MKDFSQKSHLYGFTPKVGLDFVHKVAVVILIMIITSMSSDVALQVKGIVEALVAVAALVLLVRRVVSSMSVQHSDVFEAFSTNFTLVLSRRAARCLEFRLGTVPNIFFYHFFGSFFVVCY